MTITAHKQQFHDLPVFDFPEAVKDPGGGGLPEPGAVAWRVAVAAYDSSEQWEAAFARFMAAVDTTAVRALVVGAWSDVYENGPEAVIEALVGARDRLPALRALFLGDIVMEEAEISWITQGRATALLDAFPDLEEFGVRGGQGLEFPAVRHERLRSLTVETGGMPVAAVRGVAASDFPDLVHLDLWLGTSQYGGDAEVGDLAPIMAGDRLPSLRHLALRNSEMQDAVCEALASAPVVAGLDVLDVSMGVLTDEGAAALLTGQPLTHLDRLDMSHNYLSEPIRDRLRETLEPAGVTLDLDRGDAEDDEDDDDTVWRFVAVGE
ncbi:STM4015 family protein [Streptomyces avicenniae]|uniref:STM4015 family protein n=1 Tax=Streptomyces avicenniae TaxID=500153 RepID=UPI00069BBD3E|nr:STM4015 family protein [Streptomyces avicenniae]